MRNRLRLPALAMGAILMAAACTTPGTSAAPASVQPSTVAASQPAASEPAASEALGCVTPGDLTMWERSGGNAGMVDALVAAWNAEFPDCKIVLTYIPHTEMVSKIAQGIASGEVPDLMGMDLIYAPQFEKAEQLVDVTEQIGSHPGARDRQPGPPDRRDVRRPPLRRAPVRRRVGAVLQQGPLHAGGPRSREAADQPGRAPRVRRQDHGARQRHQGLLPAGQLRRLQHLHRRTADVGLRRQDRGGRSRRRAAGR